MKKANSIKKKKQTAKPKHFIVHLKFENKNELDNLEQIKKLTGMSVGTKAIAEALVNYPNVSKRADALNSELQKINREFESMQMKFDTVKRAFKIINETEQIKDENILCRDCGEQLDADNFCDNCFEDKSEF